MTVKKNEFSLVADVDYSQLEKPWHTHHDLYFQDITFTNSKGPGTEGRGRFRLL